MDSKYREILDLANFLYKQGPTQKRVWEISGGDISSLNLSQPAEDVWYDAIDLLFKGGGGKVISLKSLIETMQNHFPNNEKLITISNSLKELGSLKQTKIVSKEKQLQNIPRNSMPNNNEDYKRAKIETWANLYESHYLYEVETFGDIQLKEVLRRLERYGICLIRLFGQDATAETTLRSIFELIGDTATKQNDFIGEIKDLLPKSGVEANTGSSAGDLGFHIDGTQEAIQPAMLMFQYDVTADIGGNSRFLDMAKVIDDLDEETKDSLLINLSRSDAATFEKKGMKLRSPIFHFPDNHSIACRLRLDAVMTPNDDCKIYLDILSEKLNNGKYEIKFKPRRGDIIIFDNWRVMHARSEIYGNAQRHHRRVWLNSLRPEHQANYLLGIRPVSVEVIAEMKRQNRIGESSQLTSNYDAGSVQEEKKTENLTITTKKKTKSKRLKGKSLNEVRLLFQAYLKDLIIEISNKSTVLQFFQPDIFADIKRLNVVDEKLWAADDIYDISINEGKILFSESFLRCFSDYWHKNSLSDFEIKQMCWLFYLHEFKHIEQGVDSNTYRFSRKSTSIFHPLDYIADSFAVKICSLICNKSLDSWKETLIQTLKVHVWGGEVFANIDGIGDSQNIDKERFNRQLIWHFQYARADLFSSSLDFDNFEIDKQITIEVFAIDKKDKFNLSSKDYISGEDLDNVLEIHILRGEKRYIYSITPKELRESLVKGLFERNLRGTIETFRPFFDREKDLIGKTDKSKNVDTEKKFPNKKIINKTNFKKNNISGGTIFLGNNIKKVIIKE